MGWPSGTSIDSQDTLSFSVLSGVRSMNEEFPLEHAAEAYENFRKQYYPKLSNDININCLQKPIGNEQLIKIVNMTMAE
jgi:hypothetical protein